MNLGDMKSAFNQAREAQKTMKDIQKKLQAIRIEVETGAGAVKAIVNGEAELIDLKIDTSILSDKELSVLPKLILKAVQEAQKKSKNEAAASMKNLAGSMPSIPGLDQLFK